VKTARSASVAALVIGALGSSALACSSPSKGEEVDTATALSQLRTPTGSFSNGASVFSGYRSKRAESAKVSTPTAGGSGTSSTHSIRLLDKATSSQVCAQGTACACPNGGMMSYKAQSSAEGDLVRVTFDACGFEDGFGFDGEAILLASTRSLLNLPADGSPKSGAAPSTSPDDATGGSKYVSVLLAAKGTATDGARKLPFELALVTEAHYVFLAVSVPDGSIVIGVSDKGDAIIRSKEGTWSCKTSARGWTCTSEKGEALEVADDDATIGPSQGSSSGGTASK